MKSRAEEGLEGWVKRMKKDLEATAYGAALRHLREDGIIQGRIFETERRGFGSVSPSTRRLCDRIVHDVLERIFSGEDWHGDHSGAE